MSDITMPRGRAAGNHERRRWVSGPHNIEMDRLRRRAGSAFLRIEASGQALAAALRVHHTTIVHRKAGKGWLGAGLAEIAALEREGHDTTPLLEAIIETQLEARGGEEACPRELSTLEQVFDNAESDAQVAYLAGAGTLEEWRQSLIRYAAFCKRAIRSLPTPTV